MSQSAIDHYVDMSNVGQKQDFLRRLGQLRGLWQITLKERKAIRSIPQNKWYWSSIIPAFVESQKEQGEIITGEDAHEIFKSMFLKTETRIVNETSGEEIKQAHTRSTTELTTKEFADYCEQCRQFLGEWFSVVVLDPNEHLMQNAN